MKANATQIALVGIFALFSYVIMLQRQASGVEAIVGIFLGLLGLIALVKAALFGFTTEVGLLFTGFGLTNIFFAAAISAALLGMQSFSGQLMNGTTIMTIIIESVLVFKGLALIKPNPNTLHKVPELAAKIDARLQGGA